MRDPVSGAGSGRDTHVPDRPTVAGLEAKWDRSWTERGTYRFDRSRPRAEIYSIDTPPPTVSGSLHVGHVFSYTHADVVARYKRMRGFEVFYPMGWDDNGLPTERRVEKFYGVRCDPDLPYDPAFRPPGSAAKRRVACSRHSFIELCDELTERDEQAFEHAWRMLGYSVDWDLTYTTIGASSRRTSQRAFLRNLAAGQVYQAEAPTMWDASNETAVAQAELEDREVPGALHRLRFGSRRADGGVEIEVDTTRPELLAACVAVVAHPEDERYRPMFGTTTTTPLFGVEVPVLAHHLADPGKGTGAVMVCTFGDVTDVIWWRELKLATRPIVTRSGRIAGAPPDGVAPGAVWVAIAGRTPAEARRVVVEHLAATGELIGEPRPMTHSVKFYERGHLPIEIVTSRQWFLRLLDRQEHYRAAAAELAFLPPFMRARLTAWIDGLNGDWLLSRQRFFGVAIPLWYPVLPDGTVDHDHPIVPGDGRLPIDPATDAPEGYRPDQRDVPGGFTGDKDVLDTWATSSLTPQIVGRADTDPELFGKVYPMDLRPQAHEIIRTWLFYTVVRSHLERGVLPWSTVLISGWVLDPDRKKMSKSKGNVVTPLELVERYGADALRHWSASGRPGTDTAFDEGQLRVGRRLATKILNAGKLIVGTAGQASDPALITAPLDRALIAALEDVVRAATQAYEAYDYARGLAVTESFFWAFCDDYLELVKDRSYAGGEHAAGAHATMATCLSVLLRLFAPVLPFVTEEVWSWACDGSVHRASWPQAPLGADGGEPAVLDVAAAVQREIRKAKSVHKVSMKHAVERVVVTDTAERLTLLRQALDDVRRAGKVVAVDLVDGDTFDVRVELAPHS